jgi:hypothetical protein
MEIHYGKELYKSHGMLWRTATRDGRNESIHQNPLCSNTSCHMVLEQKDKGYFCKKCDKQYSILGDYYTIVDEVNRSWKGHQTLDQKVYSLDLAPTKVIDEDKEDENYWVQAKISEKNGKRMAVVYFGERIKGKQEKSDYTQVFLDFEDEQLRFDKTNKNPMKLLAKLTAEFPESKTTLDSNANLTGLD